MLLELFVGARQVLLLRAQLLVVGGQLVLLIGQPLCLPPRLGQQIAHGGARARDLERDGQRLADRPQELADLIGARPEQRKLEHAGHASHVDQRHEHDRLRRRLAQARTHAQVAGRRIFDHRQGSRERRLADQPLAEAKRGRRRRVVAATRGRQRELRDELQRVLLRGEVERAGGRLDVAGQQAQRSLRDLAQVQLATQFVGQLRMTALEPIGAVALGGQAAQVLRHLVGVARERAQLVAGGHRQQAREVAAAEARQPRRDIRQAAQ